MSDSKQAAQLKRVTSGIGLAIVRFARERLATDRPSFHMEELTQYIAERAPTAPGSPGRVLRYLRSKGIIDYYVTSRSASEYFLRSVNQPKENQCPKQ